MRKHSLPTTVARLGRTCLASLLVAPAFAPGAPVRAADDEYVGKFEPNLVAYSSGRDQVVFTPMREASKAKTAKPIEDGSVVTVAWIFDPRSEKSAIQTLLVEEPADDPYVMADVDLDGQFSEKERFDLAKGEDGNPFIWDGAIDVPLAGGLFASCPVHVKYLKNVRTEEMKPEDRLVLESREVFARGTVDVAGRKTAVEYPYSVKSKKIDLRTGAFGVDTNGDGVIDRARFSPENAEAQDEVLVFRAGNAFVSTKRADVDKNEIVMRARKPSDYGRVELGVGTEMPDFEFTDFAGKKRHFTEFRGKVVLLDFWGTWCPPCRAELPYLKAAYAKFQPRGFEIIGMNTDEPDLVAQVKGWLEKNGMDWTQARRESIVGVINALRVHTFPTAILIGADGRVISFDEDSLRGDDLMKTVSAAIEP